MFQPRRAALIVALLPLFVLVFLLPLVFGNKLVFQDCSWCSHCMMPLISNRSSEVRAFAVYALNLRTILLYESHLRERYASICG